MFYINVVWGLCIGDTDFTMVCVGSDVCRFCQFESYPQFLYSVHEEPTKFVDYNSRLLVCCLKLFEC